MIETGNLSEFSKANYRDIFECNDADIVAILSKNSKRFPKIYLLLTETTKFYTDYFSDLLKFIKREKRLIVFETPSRVSITHEYTIEGKDKLNQGFHFLFNTKERLSWLKTSLEDKRISIASREIVITKLTKILGYELDNLATFLHISPEETALRLYEASDGKPCFVEFNQDEYKRQQSLLLSITYFDSIRDKASLYKKRWFSPLQEKQINYNYSPISRNANAWIYFKSPTNFVLSVSHNASEGKYEASPSNDEEIKSFVLTPKGDKLSVDFKISINVPDALKVWYNAMLYLAILGIIYGVILLVNKICAEIPDNMIETFSSCSLAIIAALIATRGWLMSEEQVMKRISTCYTVIIGVLIVLILSLSFAPNTKSNYTAKSPNSIPQNSSKVISTPPCPVIKNIQKKMDTVDKKSNDTNMVKVKTYDSSSIKNPSERTPAPPKKRTL